MTPRSLRASTARGRKRLVVHERHAPARWTAVRRLSIRWSSGPTPCAGSVGKAQSCWPTTRPSSCSARTRSQLLVQPIELLVAERFHPHHPSHRRRYFAARGTRQMGAGLTLYGRRRTKASSRPRSRYAVHPSSVSTDDKGAIQQQIVRSVDGRRNARGRHWVVDSLTGADAILADIYRTSARGCPWQLRAVPGVRPGCDRGCRLRRAIRLTLEHGRRRDW
jgi:hypothetical protein